MCVISYLCCVFYKFERVGKEIWERDTVLEVKMKAANRSAMRLCDIPV